jgi:hypothetical protein
VFALFNLVSASLTFARPFAAKRYRHVLSIPLAHRRRRPDDVAPCCSNERRRAMRALRELPDERFRVILMFAASTGVRAGELHAWRRMYAAQLICDKATQDKKMGKSSADSHRAKTVNEHRKHRRLALESKKNAAFKPLNNLAHSQWQPLS